MPARTLETRSVSFGVALSVEAEIETQRVTRRVPMTAPAFRKKRNTKTRERGTRLVIIHLEGTGRHLVVTLAP